MNEKLKAQWISKWNWVANKRCKPYIQIKKSKENVEHVNTVVTHYLLWKILVLPKTKKKERKSKSNIPKVNRKMEMI